MIQSFSIASLMAKDRIRSERIVTSCKCRIYLLRKHGQFVEVTWVLGFSANAQACKNGAEAKKQLGCASPSPCHEESRTEWEISSTIATTAITWGKHWKSWRDRDHLASAISRESMNRSQQLVDAIPYVGASKIITFSATIKADRKLHSFYEYFHYFRIPSMNLILKEDLSFIWIHKIIFRITDNTSAVLMWMSGMSLVPWGEQAVMTREGVVHVPQGTSRRIMSISTRKSLLVGTSFGHTDMRAELMPCHEKDVQPPE